MPAGGGSANRSRAPSARWRPASSPPKQPAAVAPRAGAALLPYAARCGFATVLSTAIWRRNAGRR
jgi:hypothetical protein